MERTKLLLFSLNVNSKLIYVSNVYCRLLNLQEVLITNDLQRFVEYKGFKINYSETETLEDCVSIRPHSYLFQDWKAVNIEAIRQDFLGFFQTQSPIGQVDIFAAAFFLLSRHEEYAISERDTHGRFMAKNSALFENELFLQPLINQWAVELWRQLYRYNKMMPPLPSFDFCLTYDVDRAWKWKNIGMFRHLKAMLAKVWKMDFQLLKWHSAVLFQEKEDPFDVFEWLESTHENHSEKIRFFFLLSDKYDSIDMNNDLNSDEFRNLVRRVATRFQTGIHPSYSSNRSEILERELGTFESITGNKPLISRQHFLRMDLPDTYRMLLKNGIKADYTMGYAETIGFRAGISTPFYWYDLEQDKSTDLLIVPFSVMDVTLKNYLQLQPDVATRKMEELIEVLKKCHGHFCLLWHNSSFSKIEGWEDWKVVYFKIIELLKS